MPQLFAQLGLLLGALSALLANPQLPTNANVQAQLNLIIPQVQTIASEINSLNVTSTPEVATSAAPAPVATNSAPVVAAPAVTPAPTTPAPEIGTAVATQAPQSHISVSFANGMVTINNDSGVPVRIKSLDVPGGTPGNVTIGNGMNFAQSFINPGNASQTFNVFNCSGLGSLGTFSVYGDAHFDPCMRHDTGTAKNELQPGETMTIQYPGGSSVVYQPGSIVDFSGNDVQF